MEDQTLLYFASDSYSDCDRRNLYFSKFQIQRATGGQKGGRTETSRRIEKTGSAGTEDGKRK